MSRLETKIIACKTVIEEMKELEVSHVTVTLNGTESETLSKIYKWVRLK